MSDRLSEGELGANLHFAESWLEAIGNSTRMAPYTQKKAALVDGFQQVIAVQQWLSQRRLCTIRSVLYVRHQCDAMQHPVLQSALAFRRD